MADAFTYKAVTHKFACGKDHTDIMVVNFTAPGGLKMSAYSCNMNIDLDGEPQAYAPLSKPELRPKDNLWNAGFKNATQNDALKQQYEHEKEALADLRKKRADMVAKAEAAAKAGTAAPVSGKPDAALTDLDKQIKTLADHVTKMSFDHIDENGNPSSKNPKNFGKIFWKWYGVVALDPNKKVPPYLELPALNITLRKPQLDKTAEYEDVFGRFPVVQSIFEPGPKYFVSPLPRSSNPRYPSWDQRYFLPNDSTDQTAFGALSTPLQAATGLDLQDKCYAIRLDTNDTLEFPFRDRGFDWKVAECSFATFTGLGGEYHPELEGAAKFPNNFMLLYLAFPKQQSPGSVLSKFATSSNADDFPVLLSFIAQASLDAQAQRSKKVSGDPVKAFEKWKKTPASPKPSCYNTVVQGLSNAGSNFVQHFMKTHPNLLSGDLVL